VNRRRLLGLGLFVPFSAFSEIRFPKVEPNKSLQFPHDHGAHPDYRQEWWYITGWLKTAEGRDVGFQITFFRARPNIVTDNPSAFTPRQVILAHAALSDPRHGRLRHDERAARTALGLAGAKEGMTEVWVDDWKLQMKDGGYEARILAKDFSLDLNFENAKVILQGQQGFSRKGRRPDEASYYYSRPQLKVAGSVDGRRATGLAWLDHEWSSQYMDSEAAGWDWCGLNMDDGSSLMAFRMRGKDGATRFAPEGVTFVPLRGWKSPRTGVQYPVAMQVTAGNQSVRLEPLMDDQELDARASTGTIYWEGAVTAWRGQQRVGRGYLELTGYWRPMRI
jgi:predicted secreted hydrolase